MQIISELSEEDISGNDEDTNVNGKSEGGTAAKETGEKKGKGDARGTENNPVKKGGTEKKEDAAGEEKVKGGGKPVVETKASQGGGDSSDR